MSSLIKKVIFFLVIGSCLSSCTTETNKTNSTKPKMTKKSSTTLLYVGTYTKKEGHVDGKAEGIYILEMNNQTGELTPLDTILNMVNPSYLTVHPNGNALYAVNELAGNGNPPLGTVHAFSLTENGQLAKALNTVSAQGDAPCYISMDQSGKYVLVASYMGTVAALPIQDDGSLGEASSSIKHHLDNPPGGRQDAAHPHMLRPGIDEKSVFAVDLGMGAIIHYQFEEGQLNPVAKTELTQGAGSRHLDFHPTKKWAYVLNELNNTVEAFSYTNTTTPFERFQIISALDQAITEGSIGSSAIHMHPSGQFLYAANRGLEGNTTQTIALFKIDQTSGKLTLVTTQDTKGFVPRDFAISPDGQFLLVANQDSNSIVTFRINQSTGVLEETGISQEVKTPVCLKFVAL